MSDAAAANTRPCCMPALAAAMLARLLGPGHVWGVRFLASAGAVTALAAMTGLMLAAVAGAPDWRAPVQHALRFFAAATLLGGVAGLGAARAVLARAARWRCAAASGALLGLAVLPAVIWLAIMHAGTWLEWPHRRSPLAWGSAWFYAEVYQDYLQGGAGMAAAIGAAAAAALPLLVLLVAAAVCLRQWLSRS